MGGSPTKHNRIDIWRDGARLPDVTPVSASPDPTALLRSLDEPPLADSEDALLQFATVIERSASIAAALALSAGLHAADDRTF